MDNEPRLFKGERYEAAAIWAPLRGTGKMPALLQ
jgi:hypothetical protein